MEKRNFCRKLNISRNMNAQSTIAMRCLKRPFEVEKLIFAENPGAHFTLKISAIRDLEQMLLQVQLN